MKSGAVNLITMTMRFLGLCNQCVVEKWKNSELWACVMDLSFMDHDGGNLEIKNAKTYGEDRTPLPEVPEKKDLIRVWAWGIHLMLASFSLCPEA